MEARKTSRLAVASLFFGILGLVVVWFSMLIGMPIGLLAAALSDLARRQLRRNPNLDGKGIALAGGILGLMVMIVSVLAWIFWGAEI